LADENFTAQYFYIIFPWLSRVTTLFVMSHFLFSHRMVERRRVPLKYLGLHVDLPLRSIEEVLDFEHKLLDANDDTAAIFADIAFNSGASFSRVNPMQVLVNAIFCRFFATAVIDRSMSPARVRSLRRIIADEEATNDPTNVLKRTGTRLPINAFCPRIMRLLRKIEKNLMGRFTTEEVQQMPK
jgi:hypothetical protein